MCGGSPTIRLCWPMITAAFSNLCSPSQAQGGPLQNESGIPEAGQPSPGCLQALFRDSALISWPSPKAITFSPQASLSSSAIFRILFHEDRCETILAAPPAQLGGLHAAGLRQLALEPPGGDPRLVVHCRRMRLVDELRSPSDSQSLEHRLVPAPAGRALTRSSRKTPRPSTSSTSGRAPAPIALITVPPLPITICFWDSVSTKRTARTTFASISSTSTLIA